jgi:hypothetical protein
MLERDLAGVKLKLDETEQARSEAEEKNVSLTSQLLLDFLETHKHFGAV